jgi:hypothetical protein
MTQLNQQPFDPARAALMALPGAEGALHRLCAIWDPERIGMWLQAEHTMQTEVQDLAVAMGNMLAGALWGFALNTSEPREAGKHVTKVFEAALQKKVNTFNTKSPGGVYMPTSEDVVRGGV